MTRSKIAIVVLSLILLIFLAGMAYTEAPSKYQASGTFYSINIDANDDGIPGVLSHLQGQSPVGAVTVDAFSDFDMGAIVEESEACNGLAEIPLATSWTIYTTENRDQVYLETTDQTFCADFGTGVFYWDETLQVRGGTGKFADASGIIENFGSGVGLVQDPVGNSFGALSQTAKGKIKLKGE